MCVVLGFFRKPLVGRAMPRLPTLIFKFWRSTNDALTCFGCTCFMSDYYRGGVGLPATGGGVVVGVCGAGAFVVAEPGTCGRLAVGRPTGNAFGADPTDGDGGATVEGCPSGNAFGAEPGEGVDGTGGVGPSASMIKGEDAVDEAAGIGGSISLPAGDGCAAGVASAGCSATSLSFNAGTGEAGEIGAAVATVNAGDTPAVAGAFRVPSTVTSILSLLVFKMTL